MRIFNSIGMLQLDIPVLCVTCMAYTFYLLAVDLCCYLIKSTGSVTSTTINVKETRNVSAASSRTAHTINTHYSQYDPNTKHHFCTAILSLCCDSCQRRCYKHNFPLYRRTLSLTESLLLLFVLGAMIFFY